MKNLKATMLAILVLVAFQGYSQDDDSEGKKKKVKYGTINDFQIDLGMNNFLEDGERSVDNNSLYAVRPFGSWYVALKSINDTHVTGPLHLLWGAEVSWYNFKFENESTRLEEGNNEVIFTEAPDGTDFIKSKLTSAYVGASLVPMLRFGDRRRHRRSFRWGNCFDFDFEDEGGLRVGAGGYVGYRIASHAKYVFEENNDKIKNRDRDSFYLNNIRYGVRAQLGFRGTDFFINYDLNELFQENKGPRLNAFSFGIII